MLKNVSRTVLLLTIVILRTLAADGAFQGRIGATMSDKKKKPDEKKDTPRVTLEITNEGSVHYPGQQQHKVVYRTGRLKYTPAADGEKKEK